MIRTLRVFFLTRLLREKLLLVAFMVLGVLMWFSSFTSRTGNFWREQRLTTTNLAEQKMWLSNKQKVEDSERKATASLDASKTLEGTRLFAAVEQMARDAGLTASLGEPHDDKAGLFPTHTLQVSITKADYSALEKFYYALEARSPYISIEQFNIKVVPPAHAVSLRVSSVEMPK